jgi:catechol 2,3-dioxygenase-like lactoylglutathione lyase family enzyme
MAVTGPDFLALQVRDLEASARFYTDRLGLARAPGSPPGAVVFATEPIDTSQSSRERPAGPDDVEAELGHLPVVTGAAQAAAPDAAAFEGGPVLLIAEICAPTRQPAPVRRTAARTGRRGRLPGHSRRIRSGWRSSRARGRPGTARRSLPQADVHVRR